MAADDAAVTVTLRANLKDYEAALKSAVRATERAATAAEKAISNVGKSGAKGGASNVIAVNFQKSAAQVTNDAKVMQYQLNDIFSGIASGQGIRALQQQLGQIAQGMTGQTLTQGARTMGAALVGMINPINLAVVAFGLLASVAAEYFLGAEEDAEKANKALADHAAAVRKMADTWGDLVPGLKEVADELERIAKVQDLVSAAGEVTADRLSKVADEVQKIIDSGDAPVPFLIALEDLKKAGEDVIGVMKEGRAATNEYAEFQKQLADLLGSDAVRSNQALAKAITELATAYMNAATAASQLHSQEQAREGTHGRVGQGELSDDQFNSRFGQRYGKTNEELFPSLYRAREEAARKAASASKKAADEAAREAEKAADKLTSAIVRQSATAVDYAATMLDKSETANRGEINSFLKGGGVNLDAASTAWCAAFVNASLARVGIKGSGSNVATDFLNFGKSVGLTDLQKGDILVQSRGHQAGEAGGHVGLATGQIKTMGDQITQVEILAGNSSDKVQKYWVDAYSVIARRATEATELQGDALDNLTEKSKTTATEAEKQWAQFNQQMAGAIGSGMSGFINDLIAGKDAGDAFASAMQRITSQLIDMMVQMLIIKPLMTALGGGIGGIGGIGVAAAASGGIVGQSISGRRKVSPAVFAGAPRFAAGGLVGLRPGEVPIIAHQGEMVIPKNMVGRGGKSATSNSYSMDNARISIDMANSGTVAANGNDAKQFGENVQKLIQAEMVRQSRPGGLLRKVPS